MRECVTSAWTEREKNIRYSGTRNNARESGVRKGQRSIISREDLHYEYLCTSVSWRDGLLDGEPEGVMAVAVTVAAVTVAAVTVAAAAAAGTVGGACCDGFMVAPPLFSPK